MATANECRKYAKGCLELYDMAETAEQRQTFLDMARDWNLAAARLEGVLSPEKVKAAGGNFKRATRERGRIILIGR